MADRLERFDDIFTEILIGLAGALLIAIGFAPQLLNLPAYQHVIQMAHGEETFVIPLEEWPEPIHCPVCKATLLSASGKRGSGLLTSEQQQVQARQEAIFRRDLVCLKDNWKLDKKFLDNQVSTWTVCPFCTREYDDRHDRFEVKGIDRRDASFAAWFDLRQYEIILLWFFMCAFCVKVVHEQSVMRHHMGLTTFEMGLASNVFLFLSRVVLLAMLYLVIIGVYIRSYGKLGSGSNSSDQLFAILLVVSYIVPDWVLYSYLVKAQPEVKAQPKYAIHRWLKTRVVWRWIALDLLNAVITVILFVGVADNRWGILVAFCVLALVAIWIGLGHSSYKNNKSKNAFNAIGAWWIDGWASNRVGMIMLIGSFTLFGGVYIAANLFKWAPAYTTEPHYAAVTVLGVNLLDWFFNARFFFDEVPTLGSANGIVVNSQRSNP